MGSLARLKELETAIWRPVDLHTKLRGRRSSLSPGKASEQPAWEGVGNVISGR